MNLRIACSCCTLTLLALLPLATGAAETTARERQEAEFRRRIEPLLVGRCLECHGKDRKGGLDLRSGGSALQGGESGAVIIPGKPDESLLVEYVESELMPPAHPLAKSEVAALRGWIAAGAFFPDRELSLFSITTKHRAGYDWWSLAPIRTPAVPPVAAEQVDRARTRIDRFVLARLAERGLSLSPPASRAAYIKRVSYDLIGLPPTPEEVEAFVHDSRPDAYERLVDRLLSSPRYGERWGRHWLDVVRFAESNGFERDRIRTDFWPYRDYVIESFNRDKPFDRFVREQLAGDALDPDDPECIIATGFLVAGPKNDVPTVSELERLQTRQDELDEYVRVVGTTFLGLTVGCARCHEHKFDPVSTEDYYGLTAVFSGLDRGSRVVAPPEERERHERRVQAIRTQIAAEKAKVDKLLQAAESRLLAERAEQGEQDLPAVDHRRNEDRFEPVQARFVRFTITATTGNSQPCVDELEVYAAGEENLALAARGAKATASSLLPGYKIHQVHHLNDGRYGNARSWIGNERGAGWAQIELAGAANVQRVVWGRDRAGEYEDRLATGYRIEASQDGESWTQVSSSERRPPHIDTASGKKKLDRKQVLARLTSAEQQEKQQLDAAVKRLEGELKIIPPLPTSYAAKDGPPRPAFVLERGNVRSRGHRVPPTALHAVRELPYELIGEGEPDSGPRRRLELAEWIVDPRNPLTARVMVNRIWQYHFGQGIVRTPNDFGFSGDAPSHPELLDWLAADFVAYGWRIKRLHRLIVLSEVYRQASRHDDRAAAVDGSNRLLWRMPRRRLDAESLRDAILAVAGNLDLRMGGPSFRLFRYRDGNVPDYILLDDPGPEAWRRAVYRFNIRTFQAPLMRVFDCPEASIQTPRRSSSTTALQALSLMNNRFMFEQAEHFASRVKRKAGSDRAAQVACAYRLALGREPSDEELRLGTAFVTEHGLFSLCRVLWNTNEFLYVF